MVMQDMIDVAKDDPGIAQSLMGLAGIFGAGVKVQADDTKKKSEGVR